jgi:hypothetical protein
MAVTARRRHGATVFDLLRHLHRQMLDRFLDLGYYAPIRIEAFALVFASAGFALLAFFVTPGIDRDWIHKVLGVFVGTFSLGALFILLRRFVTWLTVKPLLGVWYFETFLAGKTQPYLSGTAKFKLGLMTNLSLRTRLYKNRDEALKAASGRRHGPWDGTARSRAFSLESGDLWILYELRYHDPESTREGHLILSADEGPEASLSGTWHSSEHGNDEKHGRIMMKRAPLEDEDEGRELVVPEVAAPVSR